MKRLQLKLGSDALAKLDALVTQVNEGFTLGSITQSDVIEELVLAGRIDTKNLQRKHVDIKRYLKHIASADSLDLDQTIKMLEEYRALPQAKRHPQNKRADE
jgi:hypothetical protein